jgi:predicted SAM-dependent methyltransferase
MASLTFGTTVGVRRAVGHLFEEFALMRRHHRGLRQARALKLPLEPKLQFGSGGQPKAGWINIDLYADEADLALDLREGLPFPDNSIAFIYSEHLFEHLSYPTDAKHLLGESLRVLRPGGEFSLVIPHFGDALHAYVSGDEAFFLGNDRLRSYLIEEKPTLMHHVNYWFRQDGLHRYAYDAETLAQVVRDCGFVDVTERPYNPELDSEKRRLLHSLYMTARKRSS